MTTLSKTSYLSELHLIEVDRYLAVNQLKNLNFVLYTLYRASYQPSEEYLEIVSSFLKGMHKRNYKFTRELVEKDRFVTFMIKLEKNYVVDDLRI